ncbi:trichohyalin, partial [Reticulomyxa filosa]
MTESNIASFFNNGNPNQPPAYSMLANKKNNVSNHASTHLLAGGLSALVRSQSRNVYPFLTYCFVYPRIPDIQHMQLVDQPLPPVEEFGIHPDTNSEEEAIQYVTAKRSEESKRISLLIQQQKKNQGNIKKKKTTVDKIEADVKPDDERELEVLEIIRIEQEKMKREKEGEKEGVGEVEGKVKENDRVGDKGYENHWDEVTYEDHNDHENAMSLNGFQPNPTQASNGNEYKNDSNAKKMNGHLFADINSATLLSMQQQKSLSDPVLLNCDQDEQLSILLQLEEEKEKLKKEKAQKELEQDPLYSMGMPVPEHISSKEQQLLGDFIEKTQCYHVEAAYGILFQAEWKLE